MSKPESLELSAEDLMPSWVSDIGSAKVSPPSPGRAKGHDEDRRGRGGKGHDRQDSRRPDASGHSGWQQGGRGKGGGRGQDRGRYGRREDRRPRRAEDILPEIEFVAEPTPEAITALTKRIRTINRAYPVADIAKMVLAGEDRYRVTFRVKSGQRQKQGAARAESSPKPQSKSLRLVRCKIDGSLWLSREEAVSHVLNTADLIKEFYEVEEVVVDAPKGNFAVIAVCGMSGALLGPPNHHEYQQNIARVHRERFGNMPLEKFKSRIEMSRDEETIEQWKQEMSTAKHYRVRSGSPDVAGGENAGQKDKAGKELDGAVVPETEQAPVADSIPGDPAGEEPPADSAGDLDSEERQAGQQPGDADGGASEPGNEGEGAAASAGSPQEPAPDEAGDDGEGVERARETGDGASTGEAAITSGEQLARHFRQHFAKKIFREVNEARLPGTASPGEMSPALYERMQAEINWQRRGFPLPMVRVLCRRFEQQGLKFFKRGEKTLYVSAARPRALAKDTVLSDHLLQMLTYINEHPGTLVEGLVKHLLGDDRAEPVAKGGVPESPAEPSKAELALLADLRWLLAEGYLIEFPNSELLPGTAVSVDKRRRRPPKRAKKKRTPGKKEPAAGVPPSAKGAPPLPATGEPPAGAQAKPGS